MLFIPLMVLLMNFTHSHFPLQFFRLKINFFLLVVLECLKDRAFHIDTVYVNSLDQ